MERANTMTLLVSMKVQVFSILRLLQERVFYHLVEINN
jgi:hypothetical protein